MPADEVDGWHEYRQRNGFEVDRIVWGIAIAGSAIVNAWVKKEDRIKPADLLPRFKRPKQNMSTLIARLSALPGAKVRRRPKKVENGRR